jgi:hypothetical protein
MSAAAPLHSAEQLKEYNMAQLVVKELKMVLGGKNIQTKPGAMTITRAQEVIAEYTAREGNH